MDTVVDSQSTTAGKPAPTLVTGIRTLTCVGPQVSPESSLLTEPLPTDAADKWSLSSVDRLLVDMEATAPGEAPPTRPTGEGFDV